MHKYPTTPGQVSISLSNGHSEKVSLTSLPETAFLDLFTFSRKVANALSSALDVGRCALASDDTSINLIPLHGLDRGGDWKPILHEREEFHSTYPGFLTSKSGPKLGNEELDTIRDRITAVTGLEPPYNLEFVGDSTDMNLFARIIRGEIEQWRIWEDERHVGWLTPFPNAPGFTVLVPRKHLSSDVFSLGEEEYRELLKVTLKLAGEMKKAFGVERIGVFFEGFEIDYTHVKLIPVHQVSGSISEKEGDVEGEESTGPYYEVYSGYITTERGPQERDIGKLERLAASVRLAL
ncbi:HIT-like protein [Marasmius fiardii PR-910]|nr:HIT-like protein [Marasmius fiardii PR-910]